MDPSIACLARMSITELPYIKCFLDHYLSIGISRFYIINTLPQKETEIRDYLKDYMTHIYLENITPDTDVRLCLTQMLKHITETYTLCIDIDEFLNIHPPNKIQNIINEKYRYYEFTWLMCPNDTDNLLNKNNIFVVKDKINHKSMTLTEIIQEINEHDFVLKTPIEDRYKDANLIHYWGRTFNDVLLKSLHHQIRSVKYSCYNDLIADLANNTIPPRFKLLALLMRNGRNIKLDNYFMKIDFNMERELLKDIPLEVITKLRGIYRNYKRNLDRKHISLYPHKGLFGALQTLPTNAGSIETIHLS
jgi:hypothetical protein